MEGIISQIQVLAKSADEKARKAIITALRDTAQAIETPDDTITRIWGGQLNLAVIRIAIDLRIFNKLSESSSPMTVDQLAAETKADKLLLARLLRSLAGNGVISETARDTFTACSATRTLATPGSQGCIKHYFDGVGPVYQAMPAFFREKGYHNITDAHHTVFQYAHNVKEHAFDWAMQHPEAYESFNLYLDARREEQVTWLDVYPVEEDATNLSPDRALFVDVGGNIGYLTRDFKAKYPKLPGKVYLQDKGFPIEHALPTPGVENQVIDFLKEQPVKNAKFYYLRFILHDWPEEDCHAILKHIMDAMGPDSYILVDEMVPPDQGVPWQVSQIDLTMMSSLAAMERTESQWDTLFEAVGLKIHRRLMYTPGMCETITALVRK